MTTPAQNTNQASVGIYHREVRNPLGVVEVADSYAVAAARATRYRPASINSPRRANGTRAPQNWQSSGGVFTQGDNHIRLRRLDGYLYDYKGTLFDTSVLPFVLTVDAAEMQSNAIRQALGHFGKAQAQLGVALKEAKRTAELLTSYYKEAARDIAKVTDAVQGDKGFKRQMRDFARGWRRAPSRYVEYMYGVMPIVDDIKNAVDVLTEYKNHGYEFRLTLRGKVKNETANERSLTSPQRCLSQLLQRKSYFCKASLVFSLPSWYWDRLPTVTFFSEAYMTTRLSFVLDWALPLGSWVRGMEGFQLRPFFVEGSTTFFARSVGTDVRTPGHPSYPCVAGQQLTVNERLWYMSRVAFDTFPSEAVLRLPRLRSPLKLSHLDDAAGLAGQRMEKLYRALR